MSHRPLTKHEVVRNITRNTNELDPRKRFSSVVSQGQPQGIELLEVLFLETIVDLIDGIEVFIN